MKKILLIVLLLATSIGTRAQFYYKDYYPLQIQDTINATGDSMAFYVSVYDSVLSQWQYYTTPMWWNTLQTYVYNGGVMAYGYPFTYGNGAGVLTYDENQHMFMNYIDSNAMSVQCMYQSTILSPAPTNIGVENGIAYFQISLADWGCDEIFSSYYDIASGAWVHGNPGVCDQDIVDGANDIDNGYAYAYCVGAYPVIQEFYWNYLAFDPALHTTTSVSNYDQIDETQVNCFDYNFGMTDGIFWAMLCDGTSQYTTYDAQADYWANTGGSNNGDTITTFYTSNGIVMASTASTLVISTYDGWQHQWKYCSLPGNCYNSGYTIIKDRIVSYNYNNKVYSAAYNTIAHNWIVDSTVTAGLSILTIDSGTVSWNDNNGHVIRGYSDSLGWGNFNTPLKIDFYVANLYSPSAHNLVNVRNYTIGSDSIVYDFGDGITSTNKNQYHLYKVGGLYREMSSANYNICQYAVGQSSCQTVSFTTGINEIKNASSWTIAPNPSNSQITISYITKSTSQTTLEIYNITAQKIKTLFNGKQTEGKQQQSYNISSLAAGIYFVKLTVDGFTDVKKLVIE